MGYDSNDSNDVDDSSSNSNKSTHQTMTEPMIKCLADMGFDEKLAAQALQHTGSDLDAAVGWMLEHPDGVDDAAAAAVASAASAAAIQSISHSATANTGALSYKLVLLVRDDLGMSAGKACAQCSHASLTAYRAVASSTHPATAKAAIHWQHGGEAIIALRVADLPTLEGLTAKAQEAGLLVNTIRDAGRTQVEAGSLTVAAIGPAKVGDIDAVTGHLSLY